MSVPACDRGSMPGSASASVGFTCAEENTQSNFLVGELQGNFIFLLLSLFEKNMFYFEIRKIYF